MTCLRRRWWLPLAAMCGVLVVSGCGSGGSSSGGNVTPTTRGVPLILAASASDAAALVPGGDDYVLVLANTEDPTGDVQVAVNDGGVVLGPLPASRAAGSSRHLPQAAWDGRIVGTTPSRAPSPGRAETVGTQRVFHTAQPSAPSTVTATLDLVGEHCIIYVDNDTPADAFGPGDLADLADQFDHALYPLDTSTFGPPSDVDGNGKIILLLTPTIATGHYGYFFPGDVAGGGGNAADMVYVLVPQPTQGRPYSVLRPAILATLVHEFQHLINYNSKVILRHESPEESWLNEALSYNSEQLAGYLEAQGGSAENVHDYFTAPERYTLLERTGNYQHGHAGTGYLFLRYLADRFGDAVFSRLVQSDPTGESNVTAATSTPFEQLFLDYAAAAYLTGTGLSSDARYSIPSFNTHTTYENGTVEVNGPKQTTVDASSGRPAFTATVVRGGVRYLRLTNVPASGLQLRVGHQPALTAELIRVPTTAP